METTTEQRKEAMQDTPRNGLTEVTLTPEQILEQKKFERRRRAMSAMNDFEDVAKHLGTHLQLGVLLSQHGDHADTAEARKANKAAIAKLSRAYAYAADHAAESVDELVEGLAPAKK